MSASLYHVVYSSHCTFYILFVFCSAASCCCNNPTFPLGSVKYHLIYLWPQRALFLFAHLFTWSPISVDVLTLQELCGYYRRSKSPNSGQRLLGIHRFHLTEGKHRNQPSFCKPPTFLLLILWKGTESRSNWFGLCFNCMSSLFFFLLPSSSPPPSLFCSPSLGKLRRQVWARINTARKKQKCFSKLMSLLCCVFFLLCCSLLL